MARKFLVSLDLNKNELLNARVQNLPTASKPASPVTGQIYYDTTDNFLYFWNGTVWLRASGDFGTPGQTTALKFGNTKSDGTSSSVARADHTHSIPDILGTSSYVNVAKDGTTGNATISLIDSGVTAGTYGAVDTSVQFTVDAKGRITSASQAAISISTSQVNGLQEYIEDKVAGVIVEGEGIDVTYDDAAGHFTIDAEIATDTNRGVASFDSTDFTVTSGNVTLNTERVQDIVGGMVTAPNTESGITVTYDDANGKLDFNVADPTITLSGDVTGSATMTNLGDVTITTTVAPNSVALGTDTTGDYVAGIQGTTNEITVTNSGGEGSTVTVGLPQDVTIQRNLTVNGNLDVVGAINSVNATTVNIVDNKINLNSNQSESASPVLDSGLVVHRGAEADAYLTWNETTDRWEMGYESGYSVESRQYAVARKYAADLTAGTYVTVSGGGTVFVVNHGLNTRDVQVSVHQSTDAWDTVETDVERTSVDTVTIRFGTAPAAGAYRVVITG
jgi:hypothetical protein